MVRHGGEGVVFKHIGSCSYPGRPSRKGHWLKLKFVTTASFIAGSANGSKRSVALLLLDGSGQRIPAGNVTIPANHEVPPEGSVVKVRYLHAFRGSGKVYQPVYLGQRDGIPPEECRTHQLRFKDEMAEKVPAGETVAS